MYCVDADVAREEQRGADGIREEERRIGDARADEQTGQGGLEGVVVRHDALLQLSPAADGPGGADEQVVQKGPQQRAGKSRVGFQKVRACNEELVKDISIFNFKKIK